MGVGVFQLAQGGEELFAVKHVDPHIQLPDGLLLRCAVPVLHHAQEGPVAVPEDTAVGQIPAAGARQQSTGVALLLVSGQKVFIGAAPQQGHVAVADEDGAVIVREIVLGHGYGVAGAQLWLLHGVGIRPIDLQHVLPVVAHHENDILLLQERQILQHIVEQGLSIGLAHDLGQGDPLGLQPGALARGQYDSFHRYLLFSAGAYVILPCDNFSVPW